MSFSLWNLLNSQISFSRFLEIKYFLYKWFIQSGNSNSFHSLFPKWVPLFLFLSYLHSFKPLVKWETEVAKFNIFVFLLILVGKFSVFIFNCIISCRSPQMPLINRRKLLSFPPLSKGFVMNGFFWEGGQMPFLHLLKLLGIYIFFCVWKIMLFDF